MGFNARQQSNGAARPFWKTIPGRNILWWVALFSISINILVLVLPFYSIQVFDRVITSGNLHTLIGLTVIAVIALIFGAFFDIIRNRLLTRYAVIFERHVAPLVLEASINTPEKCAENGTHDLVKVRELRTFLSSAMPAAIVDAPFFPLFLVILFLIHPWFGIVAVVGALVLGLLAYLSGRIARIEVQQATGVANKTQEQLDSIVKHANLVRAMGWTKGAVREFLRMNDRALAPVLRGAERVGTISSIAKMVRLFLQIAALGGGAWLVIQNELFAGGMIAGSIIISRTMQPVEQLLGSWRSLSSAHEAWKRVNASASAALAQPRRTLLPPPTGALEISQVSYRIANARRPILYGINFYCDPASIVVVIGPTGAGKSTLLRMIAALDRPSSGAIRLDVAHLDQWDPEQLGQYVGYLPQEIELLGGTVAEAIAGFDEFANDADVIEAARLANAHEMILSLPQGYDTEIGRDGNRLSGGQRQFVGLARALYGNRNIVLLDEPNSNLDPDGEERLCSAIKAARARGTTFVIVTHRPRLLTVADSILFLRDGVQVAFGPPSAVLAQAMSGATPLQRARPPGRQVSSEAL